MVAVARTPTAALFGVWIQVAVVDATCSTATVTPLMVAGAEKLPRKVLLTTNVNGLIMGA